MDSGYFSKYSGKIGRLIGSCLIAAAAATQAGAGEVTKEINMKYGDYKQKRGVQEVYTFVVFRVPAEGTIYEAYKSLLDDVSEYCLIPQDKVPIGVTNMEYDGQRKSYTIDFSSKDPRIRKLLKMCPELKPQHRKIIIPSEEIRREIGVD